MKRYGLLWIGILVLIIGCTEQEQPAEEAAEEQPPMTVEVVQAQRGRLIETVQSSGLISGIREAYVVSETTGIIETVDFTLGEQVSKGDLLVKVDDTIAQLNMEQAQNQYETAQIDLNAKEASYKSGNVSRAALIQARSTAQGAKAQYQRAKKAFEDCSLSSPIDGYVAGKETAISVGNYLTPGSRVARIVDLSVLEVEVAVGEGEIGFIETGAGAVVYVPAACEKQSFEAEVVAVAAGSDPATGSFPVIVRWPNSCGEKIKAGMSAEVTIDALRAEPQLIIPSSALVRREGATFVKTVQDGTVVEKAVVIGNQLGDKTAVLEGLSEGEQVIISGLTVLSDGDQVNAVEVEQ